MTGPWFYLFLTLLFLTGGCVSRAPTKCELDKRSGMYPSSFCDEEAAQSAMTPSALVATGVPVKPVDVPVREGPVVTKVWVHDQVLDGGHWLQGSWLFVEVEAARWSGSVQRVRVSAPVLGTNKSADKVTAKTSSSIKASAFNPAAPPPAPSEKPTSARAGRGGDK